MTALLEFLAIWGFRLFPFLFLLSLASLFGLARKSRKTWRGHAALVLLFLVALISGFFLLALTGYLDKNVADVTQGLRRYHHSVGKEMPDVVFRQVSDDVGVSLADFRGQVVLVNLWATWCLPCRAEMPILDRLQAIYGNEGLRVVALSQEERQTQLEYLRRNPNNLTNVYAEQIGWLDVGQSRPISLVLDRGGVLREYVIGEHDFQTFELLVLPWLEGGSRRPNHP